MKAVWVMLGGSLGAGLRYGVTLLCVRWFGPGFPVGTLAVNLTGCFLIGVVMALAERTSLVTPAIRLFFVTGFLGGLTTFSSYAWESVNAFRSAGLGTAWINVLANNLAGLGLVLAGFWVARG